MSAESPNGRRYVVVSARPGKAEASKTEAQDLFILSGADAQLVASNLTGTLCVYSVAANSVPKLANLLKLRAGPAIASAYLCQPATATSTEDGSSPSPSSSQTVTPQVGTDLQSKPGRQTRKRTWTVGDRCWVQAEKWV